MKKIAFFDTKPYDRESFTRAELAKNFDIRFFEQRLNEDSVQLSEACDAVCIFVNDLANKAVIDALKEKGIELLALRCAGFNNVDLKHACNRIHVVRVPGYSPYSVAEHAVALIMSLNRNTHRAFYRTRDGNFSINGLMGFDLHGKCAGVIGTGKIGQCLIRILKGYGMRVLAYDPYPNRAFAEEADFVYTDLEQLFRESDLISLHCPLTEETRYIINEKAIEMMKPGVMLINTGRGPLVDTSALIKGLKSGKVGAAGLDVYENEAGYFFEDFSNTVIQDDVLTRLLHFPNVLVTAHQAFFTREAMKNIADTTLKNIDDYFNGLPLPNEICPDCAADGNKQGKKRCW